MEKKRPERARIARQVRQVSKPEFAGEPGGFGQGAWPIIIKVNGDFPDGDFLKLILAVLTIMLVLALGCTQQTPPANNTTACTQEAKICPDGSAVGRTGPNCEFAPCPQLVGNDSDAHGCKPSAGYSWCEALQKCVRVWETPCQTGQPGTPPPATAGPGSANFQRCIGQCEPGNAGDGPLCRDGCRMEEAAGTKSTALCDVLDNQANRPSCYGTVAKAAGNITVCNRLTDATDKNYCLSVFGSPGAG